MYNYFIKTIVFTVCFVQFQVHAGKRTFPNKKNESSSVSTLLQSKNDVMYDPIFGSCLTTLVRSQSFQDKALQDARKDSMRGNDVVPAALKRVDSEGKTLSAKSSFSQN